MFIEDDADAYSSEDENDVKDKIEYASDDEKTQKKGKMYRDEEFTENDMIEDDEEDEKDDVIMDELENESISIGSEEKRRKKEFQKLKKGRNIQSADLGEEENEENTIFIDNLPNDEFKIR